MSMLSTESTIWLDHLPTEIIFHIFDYLSNNQIIYTFFHFSQRLNNLLLQNQRYLTHLDLPTTNSDKWENILQIIGSQIECLNISTIDLSFPLKYFSNLKSIIISSPHSLPDEELKSITKSDLFNNLHTFKIKQEKIFFDIIYYNYTFNQNYLLEKIFNDQNSLKIFQNSLLIVPFSVAPIGGLTYNFNLYSLTLVLFNFGDVFSLIEYTPNLTYLNFQSRPPHTSQNSINNINIKVKQFYWTLINTDLSTGRYEEFRTDFSQLTNAIKLFSSSLICLSLNLVNLSINTIEKFPFNSIKLQELLESMKKLKQFHLYAKLDKEPIDTDIILSQFRTQYWSDKSLSFGMHGKYFYTLPFHFDYLYEFSKGFDDIKTNNYDILINNPRIWYNVKSVQLSAPSNNHLNLIEALKSRMPKLRIISFGCQFQCLPDGLEELHKTARNCLDSVTTIHFTYCHIEMGIALLINVLPNVNHLILSSGKLPLLESELTSILNRKIQKLDINKYSELEKLTETSYVYFSNVRYIYFNLFNDIDLSQLYANIVMKILKNFKNLDALLIYSLHTVRYDIISSSRTQVNKLIEYLDTNEILKAYQIKHFRDYCLFSKKY